MSLAPWSHIVRGGESEAVSATTLSPSSPSPPPPSGSPAIASPESSSRSPRKPDAALPEAAAADGSEAGSGGGGGNAARGKKPAWSNKPSNGVLEAGPVMGAVSWPALSESARTSPRPSSDSLKALAEGSVTPSQAPTNVSSPQKPITTNPNPNLNPNNTIPGRQKPMKRGGAANNGVISLPPVVPPQPPVDAPPPQHTSDKAAAAATVPQSSPRDLQNNNNNSGSNVESGSKEPLAPQFHNGNSHPRNSFRRGSGGGPYHNNYGNRRDNDRPNHDWNHQRSSGGRDGRVQHHRFGPRNFHRPPPVSPVFVSPPPIRAYGSHMGYPEMPSPYFFVPPPPPESFRGVPYPHVVPPVVYYPPPQDPQLLSKLVKQIDYYFSQDNLCKDLFLRQNMDEQGWVPISLIAGFNRIKHLTKDAQFILVALHTSSVVEVNGDKVRKQNDWMNWLLPANQIPVPSSSATNNLDRLATGMQSLGLEASSSGESKNN